MILKYAGWWLLFIAAVIVATAAGDNVTVVSSPLEKTNVTRPLDLPHEPWYERLGYFVMATVMFFFVGFCCVSVCHCDSGPSLFNPRPYRPHDH